MKGFDKAYENEGRAPLYADIIEEYKEGMKVDPYTYPATLVFVMHRLLLKMQWVPLG